MTVSLTLKYQGSKENLLGSGLLAGMDCGESNASGCELKNEQSAEGSKTIITLNGEDLKTPGPLLQKFATNLRSAAKAAYLFDPDGNPLTKEGRRNVTEDEFSKTTDKSKFFKAFNMDSLDSTGNTFLLGAGNYITFINLTKNIPLVPVEAPAPATAAPTGTAAEPKKADVAEPKAAEPVSDDGLSLGIKIGLAVFVGLWAGVTVYLATRVRNMGKELAADKASRTAAVDRAISAADRADKLVAPLERAQTALDSELDEHERLISDVRQAASAAVVRIEEIRDNLLEGFRDNLGNMSRDALAKLRADITPVSEDIGKLRDEMLTEAGRLLDELGRKVDAEEARLSRELGDWIKSANTSVEGVETKVGNLDEKATGALDTVDRLKNEAGLANEVLRGQDSRLTEFATRMNLAFDRLVTAEGTHTDFQATVKGLQGQWDDLVRVLRTTEKQTQGALDDFRAAVVLAMDGKMALDDLPTLDLAPALMHSAAPEVPLLVMGEPIGVRQNAALFTEPPPIPDDAEVAVAGPKDPVLVIGDPIGLGSKAAEPVAAAAQVPAVASPLPPPPPLPAAAKRIIPVVAAAISLPVPGFPLEAPASVDVVEMFKDIYGDTLRTFNAAGINQVFYDANGAAFRNNGVEALATKVASLINHKEIDAKILVDCLSDRAVDITVKDHQSIALIEMALNVEALKSKLKGIQSPDSTKRTVRNWLSKNSGQTIRQTINQKISDYSTLSSDRSQLNRAYIQGLPKTLEELAAKSGVTALVTSPVEYLAQIKTQLAKAQGGWYSKLGSFIHYMEAIVTVREPDADVAARVTIDGLDKFLSERSPHDIDIDSSDVGKFTRESLEHYSSLPENISEYLAKEGLAGNGHAIEGLITSLELQHKYPRLVKILKDTSAQIDKASPGLLDTERTHHILAITQELIEEIPHLRGEAHQKILETKVATRMEALKRVREADKSGEVLVRRAGEEAKKADDPAKRAK